MSDKPVTVNTIPNPPAHPGLERAALAVGGLGLGACAIGAVVAGPDAFFHAYLVGVIFWLEVAFGCLGIQMIHGLTGGGWGVLARRPLHAASSTLPALAVLFVPLLFGLPRLYPWARPELVAHDALLQHKAPYLNATFFTVRAALYFALWSGIALVLFDIGRARPGKERPSRRQRLISGPGILASALTMTFAAIDWVMSLDPHWYSTMFGALLVVGSLLGGMAFSIVTVTSETRDDQVPIGRLHDLGNLLLVFTMLWAYLSFCQYLIIYAGNMAEDIPFYVHRTEGGWQHVAQGLIVFHFAVPFVVLITRRTKRSPRALRAVALGILFVHLVEIFWFVAPNFYGPDMHVSGMDLCAPVGIGGLWMYWFSRRLRAFSVPVIAAPPGAAAGGTT